MTHTVREHGIADAWIPDLVTYIKTDAFARMDRPLSHQEAATRFGLDVGVRRVPRVVDAVESILRGRGWPEPACGGVTAYVVNAGSREPGDAWAALWRMKPVEARRAARAHIREEALSD
jgi:hypothetical protein